jgi:hypothetical protein
MTPTLPGCVRRCLPAPRTAPLSTSLPTDPRDLSSPGP